MTAKTRREALELLDKVIDQLTDIEAMLTNAEADSESEPEFAVATE